MSNYLRTLISIVMTVVLSMGLVGCNAEQDTTTGNDKSTEQTNTNENAASEVEQSHATITISKNEQKEEVQQKDVTFKEDENLLSVMNREFDIVDEGNGFITKIDNLSVDKEKNIWFFLMVNGKMAEVGAKDIVLKEGDKIVWDLHEFKE
jgi:hypothetical protein